MGGGVKERRMGGKRKKEGREKERGAAGSQGFGGESEEREKIIKY